MVAGTNPLKFYQHRHADRTTNQAHHGGRCLASQKDTDMDDRGSTATTDLPRAEAIAVQNDKLRKMGEGGSIMITSNVQRITGFDPAVLAAALANYDGFDADNDPHGERDFGCMTMWGYDLIWKIDYYDKELEFGSDDPADPKLTHRILTAMVAGDW